MKRGRKKQWLSLLLVLSMLICPCMSASAGEDVTASCDVNGHQVKHWEMLGSLDRNGMHIGVCSVCGETVRENHIYQDDGDCTTDVVCPKCDLVLKEGAEKHNMYPLFDANGSPYYPAKADENGITHTRICRDPECTQTTGVTEPHQFGTDGKCIGCDAVYKEEEQHCTAVEHVWSATISEEATCLKQGRSYQKCIECGVLRNVVVTAKTDHVWKDGNEEATCSKTGRTYQECSVCGAKKDVVVIPKKDHTWEWKITKEPQIGVEGERERTCEVCGYSEKETIPALPGHECVFEQDPFNCELEICTYEGCGKTRPSGKSHTRAEDDGDCTTDVVCTVCGLVLEKGADSHNLYPLFDENGSPYYKGTDNADGKTHTRICSNPGCTKTTGVTELHQFGTDGKCIVCGAECREDGTDCASGNHQWSETITEKATCLQQGKSYRKCTVCGVLKDVAFTPKADHNWSETITEDSTCSKEGRTYEECTVCGLKRNMIFLPKEEHTWSEEIYTEDSTCAKEGRTYQKCTVCGEEKKVGSIAKKEHTWTDVVEEEATCTNVGRSRKQCSVCGAKTNIVIQPKKEHTWTGAGIEAATCTKEGRVYLTCSVCGEQQDIGVLPKAEHTWTGSGMEKATCTKEGRIYRICGVCGEQEDTGVLPKAEHTWTGSGMEKATCTKEGRIYRICGVCGEQEDISVIPKTEHVWEWKTIKEPQIGEAGEQERVCEICGYRETQVIEALTEPQEPAPQEPKPQEPEPQAPTQPTPEPEPQAPTQPTPEPEPQAPTQPTPEPEPQAPAQQQPAPQMPTVPGSSGQQPAQPENPPVEIFSISAPAAAAQPLSVKVELPEGTSEALTLTLEDVTESDRSVKAAVEEKFAEYVACDITLLDGGTAVQPDGTVTVTIELPEGWKNVDVYHVDGDKMTKMPTRVENGNAVFTTTHFSVYVLVNKDSAVTEAKPDAQQQSDDRQSTADLSPKTDGRGNTLPAAGAAAVLLLAAAVVVFCKRKNFVS